MHLIETSVFTRRIVELLNDEEYCHLQLYLAERPDAGKIIPGSGGLRKLRWGVEQYGKRGGIRLIYYWAIRQDIILYSVTVCFPKERACRPDTRTDPGPLPNC